MFLLTEQSQYWVLVLKTAQTLLRDAKRKNLPSSLQDAAYLEEVSVELQAQWDELGKGTLYGSDKVQLFEDAFQIFNRAAARSKDFLIIIKVMFNKYAKEGYKLTDAMHALRTTERQLIPNKTEPCICGRIRVIRSQRIDPHSH